MRDQYPSWSPWEAAQSQDISLHLQLKGTLACSRGGLDIEGGDSVYQTHQSDPYHCSRMFFTLGNGHSQVLPTKEHHRNVPQQWDTTVTTNLAVPPLPIRTLLPRWESGGSTDQALPLTMLLPLEKAPGQLETSPVRPITESGSCPGPGALHSQQHTLVSPWGTSC